MSKSTISTFELFQRFPDAESARLAFDIIQSLTAELAASKAKLEAAKGLRENLWHMMAIVRENVSMGALGTVKGSEEDAIEYPLLAEYLHNAEQGIANWDRANAN